MLYLAESFYNITYGSSIITSKVSQKISVMKTLVFLLSSRLNHVNYNAKINYFSGNASYFVFITENFWQDLSSNNWQFIVKRLCCWYLKLKIVSNIFWTEMHKKRLLWYSYRHCLYVVLHSLLSEIDGIVSAMLGDPLMRFVPKLLLLAPLYMYTPVQSKKLKLNPSLSAH